MTRFNDAQIAEKRTLAADLRLHAKHADALARADRDRRDSVGERMWKLEARALRRRAKDHDDDIADERLWRRIDQSRMRRQEARA